MILPIIGYGHETLRVECTPFDDTPKNREIITDLKETMLNIPTAVGLALPQVNLPFRGFVMRNDSGIVQVCLNPIIKKRRKKQVSNEGCLSIPRIYRDLNVRDEIIDVEFYDENFNKKSFKLKDFESIVFQHEYDHLNGVLFVDYLTKEGREEIQDKLNEIEKGYTPTAYPMLFK